MKTFTIEQAAKYTDEKGKKVKFYWNFTEIGQFFTLKPTIRTPSGKNPKYPRSVILKPYKG